MPILGHVFKKRDKRGKKSVKADRFGKKKHTSDTRRVEKGLPDKIESKNKKTSTKKKSKKSSGVSVKVNQAHLAHNIVIRPHISEKSVSNNQIGKYVFEVNSSSSKQTIARAIEEMYGVKVLKVNKIPVQKKNRRYRGSIGSKSRPAKAIITLQKGQGIEVLPQ